MDIAVTGSSGLIGSTLAAGLRADGHRVRPIVRRPPERPDEVRWDPAVGVIDARGLEGIDALVHLAGEGIGDEALVGRAEGPHRALTARRHRRWWPEPWPASTARPGC